MLPMQVEIFHYLDFLKGSVYNSNSYKLARKEYSNYNVTICIPALFLFCKAKHKETHLEANRTSSFTRYYSLCPSLMTVLTYFPKR